MKRDIWWCVKSPYGYLWASTSLKTKKDVIAANSDQSTPWSEMHKAGYRVVKITVREVGR